MMSLKLLLRSEDDASAFVHEHHIGKTHLNMVLVLAKFLICSLTTSIPLSSEAFSSRTIDFHRGP